MKGEKRYWGVFLRTLAAFLAVWLLMAGILTVNNREKAENKIKSTTSGDIALRASYLEDILNGTLLSPERRKNQLTSCLINFAHSTDVPGDYCYTRVYDEKWGTELARSPIAIGAVALEGTSSYDHFILFDEVLTDEEQCALAEVLLADNWHLVHFYPDTSTAGDHLNVGLYGEVTGIYDAVGQAILPQKLVYQYEDHSVTVMESDHEMFDGAELTTLRFDWAQLDSILANREFAPEELLSVYYQAEELADRTINGRSVITNYDEGEWATHSEIYGVPMTYVCVYDPWQVAVNGLGFTYISTLLVAVLAAVWISHVQIRTLKRERRFTRAVAHDIKTPAAVLRAYAEALHEGTTPERQREYLESMMEESDQMAVLVNELLALSRMEGSAALLLEEDVNLTELVRYHFERLTNPLNDRGLRVQLDLYPVSVKGDTARLTQVVSNLAANLLRHAKPGPAAVTLKREGKRAVLTVANCCDPIPEEKLKHLWDPFYKVDESRSAGGSGLGLAVVKNVVELHGGTCSVRTIPDGIEFRIELPVSAG